MIQTRRVADAGRAAAIAVLIMLLVVPALAALAPGGYRSDGTGPAAVAPNASAAQPVAGAPNASASPSVVATATAEPSSAAATHNPRRPAGSDTSGDTDRTPVVRAYPGLVSGSVNRTSLLLTAEYDVALTLGFDSRSMKVESVMTVRNDSGEPIDRVELNTVAARLGGMKLGAVTVAGKPVSAAVDDQTIVVPLGGILGDKASVQIALSYTATLRSSITGSNWLFTRANGIVNAYRWLPWVSRNVAFDRPNHGDPFVTPASPRVRVAITSDRALVFATTGERVSASGLRQTFEARDVRDFVFTAAPDYKSISSAVGDTTVRVYYRPGGPAQAILAAAKNAIAKMEPLVGAYPYGTYDVAQTAGGYGMEAPGLTWIPTGVAASSIPYLVTHETAHQWFYGIVGSDQAVEPFTDEAVTDFLARHVLGQKRAASCSTARLDLSIYRYSSACYYEIVYIQGGNFVDDIRKTMGNTAFWNGLRAYIEAQRFELAANKTLLDTLDDHTSKDLVPLFEPRFPRIY
jgi:hypothetical protein